MKCIGADALNIKTFAHIMLELRFKGIHFFIPTNRTPRGLVVIGLVFFFLSLSKTSSQVEDVLRSFNSVGGASSLDKIQSTHALI